jgi:hypothetical protein
LEKAGSVFRFVCNSAKKYMCTRTTAMIMAGIFCLAALGLCGHWASQFLHKWQDPPGSGEERVMTNGVYNGDWKEGKWHGEGTLCGMSDAGIPFTYTGSFVDGLQHGQGKIVWANGEEYEGHWENGERHGQGKMTLTDGSVLDGMWIHEKFQSKSLVLPP